MAGFVVVFVVVCVPLCSMFQRSVLNATDGEKVHGHGHNVIVHRPPTFERPRPPDVNTENVFTRTPSL